MIKYEIHNIVTEFNFNESQNTPLNKLLQQELSPQNQITQKISAITIKMVQK